MNEIPNTAKEVTLQEMMINRFLFAATA